MNEKLSKRRIQIIDLQKKEIEEKQEIRLLIRLHIFYLIADKKQTRTKKRFQIVTAKEDIGDLNHVPLIIFISCFFHLIFLL